VITITYKCWNEKYNESIMYSDAGCLRLAALGTHTTIHEWSKNNIRYRVGHYVQCYDTTDSLIDAQIIDIVSTPDLAVNYKINYIGWDPKYDELIPWDSRRITIDQRILCGIRIIHLILEFITRVERTIFF